MLYSMDRIQFSKNLNKYFIFEFHKVPSTLPLLNPGVLRDKQLSAKIGVLRTLSLRGNAKLIVIFYAEEHLGEPYILWEREVTDDNFTCSRMNFNSLQKLFLAWNNVDGTTPSKLLGSVSEEEGDSFIQGLLEKVRGPGLVSDDSGLGLTKKLLGTSPTRGFDLDLFQYVRATDEVIFYEFLKNETGYLTNFQAHPMRYCWTQGNRDNRQKFISLWKAKEGFNARLFLINYSDDESEGIGVSEVLDLDVDHGFRDELKYNLSFDQFITWISRMDSENIQGPEFLENISVPKRFGPDFFENWEKCKRKYG